MPSERAGIDILLPAVQKLFADPALDDATRARLAGEMLERSGWTREEFKATRARLQQKAGGFGRVLQDSIVRGMSFNLGDEALSAMSATIDALQGEDWQKSYSRRMGEAEAVKQLQAEAGPKQAVAGEIIGAVASPGARFAAAAGPLKRIAGGVLGGAVAGAGAEQDEERLGGALAGGAFGGIGQATGEAIGAAGRTLADPAAQAVVAAAERQGVPLTAGMQGGPALGRLEQAAAQSLGGSTPVIEAQQATREAAERLSGRIGTSLAGGVPPAARPGTPAELGIAVKTLAGRTGRGMGREITDRLDRLVQAVGPDTPASIAPVMPLFQELTAALAQAPASLQTLYAPAIRQMQGIIQDAGPNGEIPYRALRSVRTSIGALLDDPALATGYIGGSGGPLRRVYGTLTDSLVNTAEQISPQVGAQARKFDRLTRWFRQEGKGGLPAPATTLDSLMASSTPEAAWTALRAADPRQLARVRVAANRQGKGAWDVIAGGLWDQLGRATPGAAQEAGEFSLNTFLTNWNKLDPARRQQFFRGTRFAQSAQAMDDLVTIAQRGRLLGGKAGHSNTGAVMSTLQLLGGLGTSAMVGDLAGVASGLAVGVGVPYLSAKAVTSPGFVRLASRLGSIRNPANMGPLFAQLRTTLDEDDKAGLDRFLAEHPLGPTGPQPGPLQVPQAPLPVPPSLPPAAPQGPPQAPVAVPQGPPQPTAQWLDRLPGRELMAGIPGILDLQGA